jgi:hypothetical protein
MSESKPTPGPWRVSNARPTKVRGFDILAGYVKIVASAHLGHDLYKDQAEREANARLIAAAPETAAERDRLKEVNAELLEVLRLTADQALRCEIPEGYGPEFRSEEWDAGYDAAISSARAAISKAKGGAA